MYLCVFAIPTARRSVSRVKSFTLRHTEEGYRPRNPRQATLCVARVRCRPAFPWSPWGTTARGSAQACHRCVLGIQVSPRPINSNRAWVGCCRTHTLVGLLDHFRAAQRAELLALILHLDHASDAEQVVAVQPDRQPAEGKAWPESVSSRPQGLVSPDGQCAIRSCLPAGMELRSRGRYVQTMHV